MAKYEVYEHWSGETKVNDTVAAFLPGADGTRYVTKATVTRINRASIRVQYWLKGKSYQMSVKDHQWCLVLRPIDLIIEYPFYKELVERAHKFDALVTAGVENWEGWDAAMGDIDVL